MLTSFNPHTHTGCDYASVLEMPNILGFNPHTHTGCDARKRQGEFNDNQVSIHTPIQGVTHIFA